MDPLSISTGVAGLVSLALQVAPAIHDYITTAKKAEQDIGWYADEVDALIEVCVCLDNFIKADATSQRNNFKTTDSVLGRTVTSCDASLRKLGSLLQVPTDWTQKLKWPFRKKTVEEIIRRLVRYTNLFQFALTVEGHTVLSNTPKDVEDLLKLQVEASQKLHEITKGIETLSATSEKYRTTAEDMSAMLEGIQSLTEASDQLSTIQRDVGTIKRQLTDSYDMEILEWLSPEHGRGRHSEVRSRRTPGTGKWLAETPDFQNWLNKGYPEKVLWLVGDPGCGKSTLLSFAVDELKEIHKGSKAAIAYYYCDYRVQSAQPLSDALGSLLRLLLEGMETFPSILRDTFEKSRREGRKPLPAELKEIILSVISSLDRCFILIDAMDEFSISNTASTSQFILMLDELASSGVDILVTSRGPPSPPLKTAHTIKTIYANDADISSYVAHALHSDDSLADVLDKTLERDISQTVVEQAKGMFLLAVLHLQNIRGQVTRSGVRKALKNLSGGLSDAYNKTFECIQHQSQARQKLAFDSLMWVSVSHRPLKSQELQHALATQPGDKEWDPDNIPSLRLIIRSCCGLLAVDDLDNPESAVRLVHNTLYHYLHNCQPDWTTKAHQLVTQTSLTYLQFTPPNHQTPEPDIKTPDKKHKHKQKHTNPLILTPFARDNWGHHAKNLPPPLYLDQALTHLKTTTNPLTIASTFGLTTLLETLLKQTKPETKLSKKSNLINDPSGTALYHACKNNHLSCASLLLQHGASPDPIIPSITPLYTSVRGSNSALSKLLLDAGANPDIPCTDGWTALHKAADDGNMEIVQMLVVAGASMSRSSARGLTALHRAAGRGFVDVVSYLLAHGARVDYTSSDCWTPLHGAAAAGRMEVVIFLLMYHEREAGEIVSRTQRESVAAAAVAAVGDDVEEDDDDDEYQYEYEKRFDQFETRRKLNALGRKGIASVPGGVNFRTREGSTALHLACQGAHGETVQALLAGGASVGIADEVGDLALHIAAREGNAEIMRVLLREEKGRGVQLDCRNMRGWTPLQEAQLSGIYEAEQLLWGMSGLRLDSDSSPAASDGEGSEKEAQPSVALDRQEKLVNAIRIDDADAVEKFFGLSDRRQGCLEARNQGGRSPLQQALLFGSLKVAKLLLDSGASVHARSDPGEWTALHYAALSGSAEAVTLCVSNGAEVNARTQQKQTPLHHACRRGAEDVVRLLLDHDADSEAVDDRSWMPVHVAAAGGHERVVRLLFKHGNIDKTGIITSIQAAAAQRGHHGLVELTRKWRYSWLT